MMFRSIMTATVAVALLSGSSARANPTLPDTSGLTDLCDPLLANVTDPTGVVDVTDLCLIDYCIWDGPVRILCIPGDLYELLT